MKIHLPRELESSIKAAVHRGRFASFDDAMAEAARLLIRQINQNAPQLTTAASHESSDPLLGVWRDAADEMDEIVADAMRRRREEPWQDDPR